MHRLRKIPAMRSRGKRPGSSRPGSPPARSSDYFSVLRAVEATRCEADGSRLRSPPSRPRRTARSALAANPAGITPEPPCIRQSGTREDPDPERFPKRPLRDRPLGQMLVAGRNGPKGSSPPAPNRRAARGGGRCDSACSPIRTGRAESGVLRVRGIHPRGSWVWSPSHRPRLLLCFRRTGRQDDAPEGGIFSFLKGGIFAWVEPQRLRVRVRIGYFLQYLIVP